MAVTDPDAHRYQRASMFLVDADTPGVEIVRDVATMEHPADSFAKYGSHAEIRYHDVRVPREALLGAEGAGFLIAQQRLYPGRIHHCMRWLGVSRRAFDMLCEYALMREAHGSKLADKQTIQNWIADSAAQMEAARLMTLRAAWIMDTEGVRAARREISLIKFFGAEVLHDVVDRALQIHGSLGYSTDMPLEAMYRYARAARFYDGPDEVHRESVAKLILRGYEPPADGIPREHVPPAARRRASGSPTSWKRSPPTTRAIKALAIILAVQLVLGGAVVLAATQDFFGAGGGKSQAHEAARRAERFDAARAWRLLRSSSPTGSGRAARRQLRALADRLRPLLPNGRFEAGAERAWPAQHRRRAARAGPADPHRRPLRHAVRSRRVHRRQRRRSRHGGGARARTGAAPGQRSATAGR